jgi:hypothetical protein
MAGLDLDVQVDFADALTIYGRLCAETGYGTEKALRLTRRAVEILRGAGEPVKLQFALETVEDLSSW